ncbi:MAG: phosphoenolpyruvate--protein phosphotransferase [Planctomycetota bacterium]
MTAYEGIPVSPGVCIGRVYLLDDNRRRIARRSIDNKHVEHEQQRIRDAIEASQKELSAMLAVAEEQLGSEAAGIFAFHRGMLSDPSITEPMLRRVAEERVTAEYAVQEQFRVVAAMFAQMSDTAFQTKVDDVWDLDHRVLRHLIGEHQSAIADLESPAIVVAPELTPTQTAAFDRQRVLGFVTDSGGQTSHTAIFARAMGIPAVVGMGRVSEVAEEGDLAILDGERGLFILNPDEATIDQYRVYQREAQEVALSLAELRDLPAETKDGTRIDLQVNIEFGAEAQSVTEHGGDGVGLFRTEFLWLTSDHEPTEDEQYEQYRKAVESAEGRPVTLRTFDLGADKYTQERAMNPERNPFLGLRSIRYCFQNPAMFKRQLRAVLRASAHGPTKVMFPLISNTLELRRARMMLHDTMEDLEEEGIAFDRAIPVGMMVEVPAAALTASAFASEVDFFSIGTNDLVQYTLAVDRTNERVADLYSAGHPGVIRLLKEIIRAAKRRSVPVSCCGEAAGSVEFALLLIGLGLRSLSVTPSRVAYLKRAIRSVDIDFCERLARTVGSFDSDRQVTAYLRDKARRLFPELLEGRSVDSEG